MENTIACEYGPQSMEPKTTKANNTPVIDRRTKLFIRRIYNFLSVKKMFR